MGYQGTPPAFVDFLKIGVPMNLVVGVASVAAIWLFFPT